MCIIENKNGLEKQDKNDPHGHKVCTPHPHDMMCAAGTWQGSTRLPPHQAHSLPNPQLPAS